MANKLKLVSVSSTVFQVAGKSFLKGGYTIEYNETSTGADGVVDDGSKATVFLRPNGMPLDRTVKAPFKNPQPWTNFLDSGGSAYADFATFTTALANLVASPANSAVSDLTTDVAVVTQGTSKVTGVTADARNVVITTVALTDAADTTFKFTLTNSKITTASNIQLTSAYAGTTGVVQVSHEGAGSGSVVIRVANVGVAVLNALTKIHVLVVN